MSQDPVSRILLIRRGGLGDALLTAPLLRALRRLKQGIEVHLVGPREFGDELCADRFSCCLLAQVSVSLLVANTFWLQTSGDLLGRRCAPWQSFRQAPHPILWGYGVAYMRQ